MFDISSLDCISVHDIESFPKMGAAHINGIYAIKNKATGEFYIGSSEHIARRFGLHKSQLNRGKHHSFLLQQAWNKYGKAEFEFIILELVSVDIVLTDRESEVIAKTNPKYNTAECTTNPMKGRKHSPESIAKMKANRSGKGLGPRVFTEAHCAALKMSKIGASNNQLGLKRTQESRDKMSKASLASFANGRVRSHAKPLEFRGKIYASGIEAANDNNITRSNLSYRINKHGEGHWLEAA